MCELINITKYEDILFNNKEQFIEEFIDDDVMTLTDAHWNSCSIKIVYLTNDKKRHTSMFCISLWNEFYEKYK